MELANREGTALPAAAKRKRSQLKAAMKNWQLYLFIFPMLAYVLVFHYFPMYGVQIAFKEFVASKGIWGSEWVGTEHLERFFKSYYFWTLIKNTVLLNLYQLALFPLPVVAALLMNELKNGIFKKMVQTVSYAPHFISVVVMTGMIAAFLNPTKGIVNKIIQALGGEPVAFLTEPGWFKTVFVLSGEWQNLGWGAIIYLAALTAINPDLHEAATIDGASRLKRIWHINLPGIMPTVLILFILNMGSFMSIGFEKIYLLQNKLNLEASDVIQTYVYRSGLLEGQYSFSAAIGLFNSVINFVLLIAVNQISKRAAQTSLW
ncbi:ABC transporter permease [Paenibacillus contaminans]|uniref:Sugar ABC transporter permease n=1 Tax=Paenibacillus contaminans TaxID=450362 RepID=A0A329MFQ9_9BACL|nr:sugar ABC transporter permease [Paenibacillus contaminans]